MVPSLDNMNSDNKSNIFTSKNFRIGHFIFEDDKYTTVYIDIIKGDY